MIKAVIIPSYKVRDQILETLAAIGSEVSTIYVVDDKCPQNTGSFVEHNCEDDRVRVIYNEHNLGVGGAMIAGYRQAMNDGMEILVKIDGDGQMDASLINSFCSPIENGLADYTKGNRFFSGSSVHGMPFLRLFGNAVLSFMTKLSSGYWNLFDPTNGYTAIHTSVAACVPWEDVSKRYFFESDVLFQLGILRAAITDVPIVALYDEEESNLKISKVLPEFLGKHTKNTIKRIIYCHFVRGFSIASVSLILSLLLLIIGALAAMYLGISSNLSGNPASTGSIISVALMLIFGVQLMLMYLSYDIANTPTKSIHPMLRFLPQKPQVQSSLSSRREYESS